jgi:hypothetical protein
MNMILLLGTFNCYNDMICKSVFFVFQSFVLFLSISDQTPHS